MNANVQEEVPEVIQKVACYHCGDICNEGPVSFDNKEFCCEGCKLVYSILTENNLGNFYKLNEAAGSSQRFNPGELQYGFLDNDKTIAQLIDYADETITRVHFHLPQIHCSSCLWLLEHLHLLNDNIVQCKVNFLRKEAHISFSHEHLSLRQLVELLSKIGYSPLLNLNELGSDRRINKDRSLYYKLGLAGFVFGNIMLLSFPEYLGFDSPENPMFGKFLNYLNFLLILPVLLYSGKDYFISAYYGIKQKHLNIDVPISLGILAIFLRSTYEIFSHTGPGYLDSLAGLIFFLLIGRWFQQITYNKINFERDYKSYFPIACNVVVDGNEHQVTLDNLRKGDIINIRHGELVPTDSILTKGAARIDYSFVTGEAEPVQIGTGDLLYAGGRQMGGLIQLTVSKEVSNSYLTQLWNDSTFSKPKISSTASVLADRVASVFTFVILFIAVATLIYWISIDIDIAIQSFSAVLIVACPCAVALSIPFTFGNAVRILARKGIYLKNTQVIESLARIDHVVFDKTGTLTESKSKKMNYEGESLSEEDRARIKSVAWQSIHPRSRQLADLFADSQPRDVKSFQEIHGKGVTGYVDGHFIRLGSQKFVGNGHHQQEKSASVYIEIDQKLKGVYNQQSQYRSGLKEMISSIKRWAGVSLLSGDNSEEEKAMASIFGSEIHLNFNQQPKQKLDFIKSLQHQNHSVAMIGDGLNDAGALSQSDIGIAITENSSYFSPSSDIIVEASNFGKLPSIFSYARSSIYLVYCAYLIAFLYNIIGLSYAVQGALSPVIAAILMPISSITIVLFGVISSSLLAYRKGLLERQV